MKGVLIISLLLGIIFFAGSVSAVQYDSCGEAESAGIIPAGMTCEQVDTCGYLSGDNTYHLLLNDVSSGSTCFTFGSNNNIVLDLNEYTMTYATTDNSGTEGDPTLGIYINGNYNGVVVKNGFLVDNNGETGYTIAIYLGYRGNIEIHDLEMYFEGNQAFGIRADGTDNLSIYNNNLVTNATKANPCDHWGGQIKAISINGMEGVTKVYNNNITGRGMFGMKITDCERWDPSTPALIYNNYISMWSPVRDGYAIGIEDDEYHGPDAIPETPEYDPDHSKTCSDGIKIYNNTIDQINARGILVGGHDVSYQHGPRNVEVFGNNITVREGWDCEYDASGTAVGIRVRFGAGENYIHDNYIKGYAGTGVAQGSGSGDGATTTGLYVGAGSPWGINNVYENNIINVETNDANFWATGIYRSDATEEFSTFINNTVVSNHIIFRNYNGDGVGHNNVFINNTFIRGTNPLNFMTMRLGGGGHGAQDFLFLDTLGLNGADVRDITFLSGAYDNVSIAWTLTVNVNDGINPLDAQVYIEDFYEAPVTTGSTTNGIYSTPLTEVLYAGNFPPGSTTYSPHNVSVTYLGETKSQEVTMDAMKTLDFEFGDSLSRDVNSDGDVNLIDLVLTAFNQGHTEADYAHLDIDQSGSVDWVDVLMVLAGI